MAADDELDGCHPAVVLDARPTLSRAEPGGANFNMTLTNPAPLSIPEGLPILLRDLIHEYTGIYFDAGRFDILLEKLAPLVSARGYRSYMEYYYLLKYEDRQRIEWQQVIEVLSVQETYYWREIAQINLLVKNVVPAWFASKQTPLRIWSAACATGEEPYTIAIALQEAGWGNHPIEIVGSDASEVALGRARRAIYRERSFRSMPAELREKYFREVPEGFETTPLIRSRVRFHRANILEKREIAGLSSAPVIFCRNLFIYFSPETIRRALYFLADAMPSEGYLFVGASESLRKLSDDFDLQEIQGAFVYVRRPRPEARR
jgi:chemotaxis protein methyltransferase CheR